jgi:hypothetical protein
MKLSWNADRWESTDFDDRKGGVAGMILHATSTITGEKVEAGRISYWDSQGQFFVSTVAGFEIPVYVLYAALKEAKSKFAPWLKGDDLPIH